jgi:hypothetical protein
LARHPAWCSTALETTSLALCTKSITILVSASLTSTSAFFATFLLLAFGAPFAIAFGVAFAVAFALSALKATVGARFINESHLVYLV